MAETVTLQLQLDDRSFKKDFGEARSLVMRIQDELKTLENVANRALNINDKDLVQAERRIESLVNRLQDIRASKGVRENIGSAVREIERSVSSLFDQVDRSAQASSVALRKSKRSMEEISKDTKSIVNSIRNDFSTIYDRVNEDPRGVFRLANKEIENDFEEMSSKVQNSLDKIERKIKSVFDDAVTPGRINSAISQVKKLRKEIENIGETKTSGVNKHIEDLVRRTLLKEDKLQSRLQDPLRGDEGEKQRTRDQRRRGSGRLDDLLDESIKIYSKYNRFFEPEFKKVVNELEKVSRQIRRVGKDFPELGRSANKGAFRVEDTIRKIIKDAGATLPTQKELATRNISDIPKVIREFKEKLGEGDAQKNIPDALRRIQEISRKQEKEGVIGLGDQQKERKEEKVRTNLEVDNRTLSQKVLNELEKINRQLRKLRRGEGSPVSAVSSTILPIGQTSGRQFGFGARNIRNEVGFGEGGGQDIGQTRIKESAPVGFGASRVKEVSDREESRRQESKITKDQQRTADESRKRRNQDIKDYRNEIERLDRIQREAKQDTSLGETRKNSRLADIAARRVELQEKLSRILSGIEKKTDSIADDAEREEKATKGTRRSRTGLTNALQAAQSGRATGRGAEPPGGSPGGTIGQSFGDPNRRGVLETATRRSLRFGSYVGLSYLFYQVAQYPKEIIQASDALTLLQNRLRIVIGSSENFGTVFNKITGIAKDNGAEIRKVTQLYTQLRLGLRGVVNEAEQAEQVTDVFLKTLRLSGTNALESRGAILQFYQAIRSGRLHGDELRTLFETNPVFIDILSRNLEGRSVRGAARRGELTRDFIIGSLKGSQQEVDREVEKLELSLEQRIQNIITTFVVESTEIIKSRGLFENIRETLIKIDESLQGEGFSKGFSVLVETGNTLLDIVKSLGTDFRNLFSIIEFGSYFIAGLGIFGLARGALGIFRAARVFRAAPRTKRVFRPDPNRQGERVLVDQPIPLPPSGVDTLGRRSFGLGISVAALSSVGLGHLAASRKTIDDSLTKRTTKFYSETKELFDDIIANVEKLTSPVAVSLADALDRKFLAELKQKRTFSNAIQNFIDDTNLSTIQFGDATLPEPSVDQRTRSGVRDFLSQRINDQRKIITQLELETSHLGQIQTRERKIFGELDPLKDKIEAYKGLNVQIKESGELIDKLLFRESGGEVGKNLRIEIQKIQNELNSLEGAKGLKLFSVLSTKGELTDAQRGLEAVLQVNSKLFNLFPNEKFIENLRSVAGSLQSESLSGLGFDKVEEIFNQLKSPVVENQIKGARELVKIFENLRGTFFGGDDAFEEAEKRARDLEIRLETVRKADEQIQISSFKLGAAKDTLKTLFDEYERGGEVTDRITDSLRNFNIASDEFDEKVRQRNLELSIQRDPNLIAQNLFQQQSSLIVQRNQGIIGKLSEDPRTDAVLLSEQLRRQQIIEATLARDFARLTPDRDDDILSEERLRNLSTLSSKAFLNISKLIIEMREFKKEQSELVENFTLGAFDELSRSAQDVITNFDQWGNVVDGLTDSIGSLLKNLVNLSVQLAIFQPARQLLETLFDKALPSLSAPSRFDRSERKFPNLDVIPQFRESFPEFKPLKTVFEKIGLLPTVFEKFERKFPDLDVTPQFRESFPKFSPINNLNEVLNFERLIKDLKRDEGFQSRQYKDTRGFPTIGFGTQITPANRDSFPGDRTTQEQAERFLRRDAINYFRDLINKKPIVAQLSGEQQRVLGNMAYNLGVGGLLNFSNMWEAIQERNFQGAAAEIMDSDYFGQVGNRSKRIIELFLSGVQTSFLGNQQITGGKLSGLITLGGQIASSFFGGGAGLGSNTGISTDGGVGIKIPTSDFGGYRRGSKLAVPTEIPVSPGVYIDKMTFTSFDPEQNEALVEDVLARYSAGVGQISQDEDLLVI